MTRAYEPPPVTVSYLVAADDGECGWGVEVGQVEAVLDAVDPSGVIDAARFGFPGLADRPERVIRLRGATRDGGVAVRRRLAVVTVPRDEVHELPPLVAASLGHPMFSAVVFAEAHLPFLILDVDAVLGAAR